jgi:hypothetical protein
MTLILTHQKNEVWEGNKPLDKMSENEKKEVLRLIATGSVFLYSKYPKPKKLSKKF